jgi:alpha-D-ribose 1-methylphosphonate 5-triphosphate synthase subunit PhnH
MTRTITLAAGLPDTVHDTQLAFRAVLDALARPGQVSHIGAALPGVALSGAMARLLLTLCDDDTPVWWPSATPELLHWLRFHTGASQADQPEQANFAVFNAAADELDLLALAQGSAASPEFSCTLLIELPGLCGGLPTVWRGPGIEHRQPMSLPGLPAAFWAQWAANHAAFPQGVDVMFTCAADCVCLPRSTQVQITAGG